MLTDVKGIKVGHWTDRENATGCTVVLCEDGAVAGVDVRGGAPGTREAGLLAPGKMTPHIHGLLLSGGSAFGLDAAAGVMRYLEERGVGFKLRDAVVPIVPAAIIFDLGVGSGKVRPGPDDAYQACRAATGNPFERGSVGAGAGATVGKVLGMDCATKGGLGAASGPAAGRWTVAALVVVNAYGDVLDPHTGRVVAGPRRKDGPGFLSSVELLSAQESQNLDLAGEPSTTLAVVATDAPLNREQASVLARVAHNGLARAVQPCHLMRDGDVTFALATGKTGEVRDIDPLLAATPGIVAAAILDAVRQATSLAGAPAIVDLPTGE